MQRERRDRESVCEREEMEGERGKRERIERVNRERE